MITANLLDDNGAELMRRTCATVDEAQRWVNRAMTDGGPYSDPSIVAAVVQIDGTDIMSRQRDTDWR